MPAPSLNDLPTPCLLLRESRLGRNLARMAARARRGGVDLRPHCKTAKSAEVARRATAGFSGAITVATLNEAEYFAAHGFRDITYSVCAVPSKLGRIGALQAEGVRVRVVTDSVEAAKALVDRARSLPAPLPVLVEVDADLHRTGVAADSDALLDIARILHGAENAELAGVLTFGGKSYGARSIMEIREAADVERTTAVRAASRLRLAGLPCLAVSVGSTPTMTHGESLEGVTEIRPGVYVFMDLMQVALGVCAYDDIAVTVLATVISHNREYNRVYIDAGALALSKDQGIAREGVPHAAYGLIAHPGGRGFPNGQSFLGVVEVNQEHGFVTSLDGAPLPFERLAMGQRVEVLPNHVCHTIGAYDRYHVVDDAGNMTEEWDRTIGW